MDEFYEKNGIWGRSPLPPVAGGYRGTAIVLGSAACLWDDIKPVAALGDYISVNHAGLYIHLAGIETSTRLKHWASLHADMFPAYRIMVNQFQGHYISYHANESDESVDFAWHMLNERITSGTSAMFAAMVGLALGYDRIILAGCPLDDSAYLFSPPDMVQNTFNACGAMGAWEYNLKIFKDRVFSMSGNTKKLLGGP